MRKSARPHARQHSQQHEISLSRKNVCRTVYIFILFYELLRIKYNTQVAKHKCHTHRERENSTETKNVRNTSHILIEYPILEHFEMATSSCCPPDVLCTRTLTIRQMNLIHIFVLCVAIKCVYIHICMGNSWIFRTRERERASGRKKEHFLWLFGNIKKIYMRFYAHNKMELNAIWLVRCFSISRLGAFVFMAGIALCHSIFGLLIYYIACANASLCKYII